ncbi:NAD(P)H-dependent flavin oxidoreductase [Clostridium luticellarii]|jgi:NAD(P)H-dependent flavin oxidoreductase YrpB (nitropropane dioxygenase family)|uniref:Probable nitronate monooxygenase n=1 Tax=Clostridium luticellarii TaxID=1691940 RepID=A0A2T0BPA1_9CLOT|nr:nitronate monooxygenase family protein [Clostridium luticellarii]MCI1944648.1 nitronate monooxygenase family protein [Clostridium luticellarii]MCI1968147.1 nitronate monooxygenase family protein [Clostridium luticellarii]MCI1994740.1 nitronate monooxygenase family protein [Clostridium luticellarii]MCI2038972.1 nitronate monooxygenase family protein [Clostridium luticellarii]PRR85652.1 Nitronate monooxygenase [Clostridium luticellarii]
MKLPPLIIGDLKAAVPIIQGGMGVGVSGYRLTQAVAKEGGIGVISTVQIGYREPDFEVNTREANVRALRKEIRKARELCPGGIIGVNIMVAINDYDYMVKTSVEEKADIIISGAGLPLSLPKLVSGSNIKLVPIVSSGKAASLIMRNWIKKYNRIPDAIVVEGPKAGGHLGFHLEQLQEGKEKLEDIVCDVIEVVKSLKCGKKIPVIAAGGIYTGQDIVKFLKLGASGVQMGTRFVATEECDAHINFKKAYIDSRKEDIKIIKSPVGLPGRAIRNKLIRKAEKGRIIPYKCYNCLKKCDPGKTPYCISEALINSVRGNTEEGLVFVGSNAYRVNKIVKVKELIKELVAEAENL